MSERFILIGHPVGHSLSPAIHGAAYRWFQRDARYELVDAPDEEAVARVIQELREGRLTGANVTVPWKRVALGLADRVDVSAEKVGAANVLARAQDGAVVAYNTDAGGLAGELRELVSKVGGWGAAPAACVIGNGGAALGAVVACQSAGAERVYVAARSFRADTARDLWPRAEEFQRLGAELVAWPEGAPERARVSFRETLARCRLLVQATSAGMKGADPGERLATLFPWPELSGVAAYDLVYNPSETPFLRQARAHGLAAQGGLGMLVRQAALALEIWWGTCPPFEPLFAAAQSALAGSTPSDAPAGDGA